MKESYVLVKTIADQVDAQFRCRCGCIIPDGSTTCYCKNQNHLHGVWFSNDISWRINYGRVKDSR